MLCFRILAHVAMNVLYTTYQNMQLLGNSNLVRPYLERTSELHLSLGPADVISSFKIGIALLYPLRHGGFKPITSNDNTIPAYKLVPTMTHFLFT